MLRIIAILQLVLLLDLVSLWSQTPKYFHFDVDDGLPSSEVYDINIDHDGRIWCTTDRGLAVYNGYGFETYTTANGLTHNTNFELFEVEDDRTWLIPFDGGLSYLEDDKISEYTDARLKEASGGRWFTTFRAVENELLLASFNHFDSLYTLQPDTRQFNAYSIDDVPKRLLHGTSDTIFHLEGLFQSIFYCQSRSFAPLSQQLNENEYIFTLWLGQSYYLRGNELEEWRPLSNRFVDFLWKEKEGKLWAGTDRGAFLFVDGNFDIPYRVLLKDQHVTSVAVDLDGNYWLSTLHQGIFMFPSLEVHRLAMNGLLPSQKVLALDTLGAYLLLTNAANEILAIDTFRRRYYREFLGNSSAWHFNTIAKHVYIGDKRILLEADTLRFLTAEPPFALTAFEVDSNIVLRSLVVGFTEYRHCGAHQFDLVGRCPPEIVNKRINSICRHPNTGQILIGTYAGVFELVIEENKELKIRPFHADLMPFNVSEIKAGPAGGFWLSTVGNGLLYADDSGPVLYNEMLGQANSFINTFILVNDSTLWLATNKGLTYAQFSLSNRHPILEQSAQYTTRDGLHSNYINDVLWWRDTLWVANNAGLNYVQPDDLERPEHTPDVSLNKVYVLGDEHTLVNDTCLGAGYNDLAFHYTAMSLRKPTDVPFYRYRLQHNGQVAAWYLTNDRSAFFSNLPAGRYQFSVCARSAEGSWSPSSDFTFSIRPPIIARWWFIALIACLTGGLLYWIVQQKLIRQQQEQELKLALLKGKEAELVALRNQMNPHFIFNALNAVQNFMIKQNFKQANYYLSRFAHLIRRSLDYSKLKSISLAQELAFLQLYIELEQMRFPGVFEFEMHTEHLDALPASIKLPPLLLQPLLENAIKHAFRNIENMGFLRIGFNQIAADLLAVSVLDNGKGMPLEKQNGQHQSHGLSIIANRINLLNENDQQQRARFELKHPANGIGLEVHLTIPITIDNVNHESLSN